MKITVSNVVKGVRYLKHYGFKEFLIRLQEKKEAENATQKPGKAEAFPAGRAMLCIKFQFLAAGRQQADAIISAREKIVEGAVSMVKMAIDQLAENEVVELDEERKAAMVSNLLVVLCSDESAQPVVNAGTLHH